MGGLIFIAAIGLWVALCGYVAFALMLRFKLRRIAWLIGPVAFLSLLIAPFLDHLVGMKQFEELCRERAISHLSPEASIVRRARRIDYPITQLSGYWIAIRVQRAEYVDVDSGKSFLWYEAFHTSGGRIAGIAWFGGTKSCWPSDGNKIAKKLNINELLQQGIGK